MEKMTAADKNKSACQDPVCVGDKGVFWQFLSGSVTGRAPVKVGPFASFETNRTDSPTFGTMQEF